MQALSIAATGMAAQDLNVQVIANNIANINTTAFKRARAEFTDLIYQAERLQGVSSRGQNNKIPQGAQLGLGVRTAAIRNLNIQGTLTNTGNQLDLALSGRGWFQVTGADGGILYTRAGSFSTNATGQIVTQDGFVLSPAMTVPANTVSINISQSGQVTATLATQTAPQIIGQITLANFPNEAGLLPLGGNLAQQTEASGTPTTGLPGDPGFALISQGYLESSNVDPVKEITDLISAQRAYEMNSKVIQAASEMASTVSKNLGA
ncbi:MAG TPA: flagellar basal-body rod protein FlgG [Methylocella sp.]|nr:flagellar basal-body rod protein FlgG [Methylocella sp.]